MDVGGTITDIGLGLGAGGFLTAGFGTLTLNPAAVLIGGGLVAAGATFAGVGGLITVGGASLMALGGAGKEAAKEIGTQVLTRRIPEGVVKDAVGKGIGELLDQIPEINQCRPN